MEILNDNIRFVFSIGIFLLMIFIAHITASIRRFEFDFDNRKIRLTLRNHSVEEVDFSKIDKIKYTRSKTFYIKTSYGMVFLRGGAKNRESVEIIKKIIMDNNLRKRRDFDGKLIWEKVDGYVSTEDDLNFSFVRFSPAWILYGALVLGVIGIFIFVYFYKLIEQIIN